MKKLSKSFISICIGFTMILTVLPFSAFAANYSVNYWEHSKPTRTLYYTGGSQLNGDDVKWFQCAINNLVSNGDCNNSFLNTSKLDVDGYFGPASKTALLAFQNKYGLTQDGRFGPDCRNKMDSVLRPAPSTSPSTPTSPSSTYYPPVEKTIDDGVYYIRNKHSNKYIDVRGGSANNGTEIIQHSYNGNANQKFRIQYQSTGYYKIFPTHCSNKCMDLGGPSEANTNGADLQIYDASNSFSEQNFSIRIMNDGSVEIGTVNSNGTKVLEVTDSSYSDYATVQIWERSDIRNNDNWYLEPANVAYYANNPNMCKEDLSTAGGTVEYFHALGYLGSLWRSPRIDDIKQSAKSSEVLIFHGHGSSASFSVYDGQWFDGKQNQNKSYTVDVHNIKDILPKSTAAHISLVYFASCNSADKDPKTKESLLEVAVSQGVKCAIGFNNNVSEGGLYINDVMEVIKANPSFTIRQAINETNKQNKWLLRRNESYSPSNTNNLVIYGNDTIRLGRKY